MVFYNLLGLTFFIAVIFYLRKKRKERVAQLERKYMGPKSRSRASTRMSSNDDLVKGYELHVTPKVTTRLKILKLRGTKISEAEERSLDFRMDEAVTMPITKSWNELGFDMPEPSPGDVWTDVGMLKGRKLERYYEFLVKFRSIIEDESLSPPERYDKVRNIDSPFLPKLYKEYGENFPKNLFIDELAEIDGVSNSIAEQLFDMGIYDSKGVSKLSRDELKELNGAGEKRAERIINATS